MNADVVLEQRLSDAAARRIVVETKFADALTTNAFQQDVFKSGHLYQLYAYLQTQVGQGDAYQDEATGVLLYPVVDDNIDEYGVIQCHTIKLATVDLTSSAAELRRRLLEIVGARGEP